MLSCYTALNDKIYFAVKDVSVQGGHTGSFPHQNGDGHNAQSSLIKTIDYSLRAAASSSVTLPIGAGTMAIGAGTTPISVQ